MIRITPHRQLQLQIAHSQSQTTKSAGLQNDISSGVRVHRPSDDPQAQQTILNQRTSISRIQTQLDAISRTQTYLNSTNTSLLDAQNSLTQAKSLALQARQAVTPFEFSAIATEVEGVLSNLDSIANRKVDGRYLFGGVDHDSPPYTGIIDGPTDYHGSEHSSALFLTDEAPIPVLLSGTDVFNFRSAETNTTTEIFATLRDFRDTLHSAGSLSVPEFGERIDAIISHLDQASDHLLNITGQQSVSLAQLDRIQSRAEDLELQARQILSDTESTDAASAIIHLQEQQNLLQVTFASTVRLLDLSVLDFLA